MELNFTTREKKVGAFMIVIALVLLATIFAIGRGKDWFRSYVHYYTILDETYNLTVDAAVKMSKADIGKVKKISLVGDKVRVEIAILNDYASRIKADSIAIVESPTFIGSEYVSIKPGSSSEPPIPPDGEIRSQAKKSIDDVMAEFRVAETAKKVVEAVRDLSEVAAQLRNPEGPLFTALHTTNRILEHIENVTRDVKDGKGPVGDILKSEAMVKNIRQDLERIDRILGNIDKTTEQAPEIMQGLQAGIQDVRKILADVEKGSTDVPEVTRAAKQGIGEARDSLKNVDGVVQSIKKNPFIRLNIPRNRRGKISMRV